MLSLTISKSCKRTKAEGIIANFFGMFDTVLLFLFVQPVEIHWKLFCISLFCSKMHSDLCVSVKRQTEKKKTIKISVCVAQSQLTVDWILPSKIFLYSFSLYFFVRISALN